MLCSSSETMRRHDDHQVKNIAKLSKSSQELRTVKLPPVLPPALPSTSTADVDLDREEDDLNSELFIPLI